MSTTADRAQSSGGRVITFTSSRGGSGRTMALANTAWILASAGRRVLAVDWDLEAPSLHRYFRPFLDPDALAATAGVIDILSDYCGAATACEPRGDAWHRPFARVQPHAVSVASPRLGWRFPAGGSLDFLSAGRQDRAYAATVSSFAWEHFYERLGGGVFLDALRRDMKAAYDYVLIDGRTGLSDAAGICAVHLPDVLVVCFTLSDQALEGAAATARTVGEEHGSRTVRVLPVPMRVDEGEREKADAGRALARERFEGLPYGLSEEELTAYWKAVEIPYRPSYAFEETPAVFGDEAGLADSLLSAYERLTGVLTDGVVTSMPPVPEPVRLRCRDAYLRRRPAPAAADVTLTYVAEDRMWADWVEAVLTRAGCRVTRRDVSSATAGGRLEGTGRTLVLLSTSFLRSRAADAVWRGPAGRRVPSPPGRLVPLRTDDVRLPASYLDHDVVDLHRLDEEQCVNRLLRILALPAAPFDSVASGPGTVEPRFAGGTPRIRHVPRRNPAFTGRTPLLEALRGQLGAGVGVVPPRQQTLFGLGGVGKTQIALEYAHRFMADYDLVWWVDAEETEGVASSLAELAVQLGVPVVQDTVAAAREAVRLLNHGGPFANWLLVYDNADDPEQLAPYLPAGGGHILITSRNHSWALQSAVLPVDVFLRSESVEHLTDRAPGLSAREADRLAEVLGDLPQAVELAGAWVAETASPVDVYLEQLREHMATEPALDCPATVAATGKISVDRLRERSPASARLLELCAFFAPQPISAQLLYGREMLAALLPYDPALRDRLVLGRVIREVLRFALATIDQPDGALQLHRLVRAVIRAQLSDEEQREARHVVHTVLAGARPDGEEPVDDPETYPRFAVIWPHLSASQARYCRAPDTRRLLVDRVRYLCKRGDTSAYELAQELLAVWRDRLGEDDIQCLALQGLSADVLRSLGRFVESREIDEHLLERQRAVLGPTHPLTYTTTSRLACDLAALGAYESAVALAHEAHEGFSQIFHASHRRTLSAANNLALTLRMVGRYSEARLLDEDVLNRRTEVLGPDHPYTLASAERLGRDLREVGRYAESVSLLSRTYEAHQRVLGLSFPGTLRCATSLAVSLRRSGRFQDALRLATATRTRYRAQYEMPTPETLACDLAMAACLFAVDDRQEARRVAQEAVEQYMKVPGEAHPYTQAALNNLGIYHWGCGDIEKAEQVFSIVLPRMSRILGDRHPHTLFCSVNFATVLAGQGRLTQARAYEEAAVAALGDVLGAHHPETLSVVANLSLTLTTLGETGRARFMREAALGELRHLLGDENSMPCLASDQRRICRDLEPLTV